MLHQILNRVPSRALTLFTRQMSAMLSAGLPLSKSLATLSKQTESKNLKKNLEAITFEVQGGSSFAEALRKKEVFPELYCGMVAAGEASGTLDAILKKLALYLEKREKIKRKILSAMTYPVVILGVSVLVIIALLTFVIPTFAEMFTDMGKELPGITKTVIGLSGFIASNIVFVVLGLFAFIVLVFYIINKPETRAVIDSVIISLPIVGNLAKKAAISRFASTLGSLLNAGIPLVDAMSITAGTAGNHMVQKAVLQSLNNITRGKSIAQPLEETGIFPPMVTQMVSVGEETGQLPDMLLKVSEFYDDEIDAAVESVTRLMEPLMILVLGVVVAGLLIAMYLPMFDMVGSVQ